MPERDVRVADGPRGPATGGVVSPAMEWARDYYDLQSRTFARGSITDQHRAIAQRLHGWCGELPACRRVLELGAGAGGTAAALADLGHDVWAIEFNASDAALARAIARETQPGSLTIIEDDFYDAAIDTDFDFIFYWDGFGIGTDADQRRLLHRIGAKWLAPGGRVLIDVFSPWNWLQQDGDVSEYTAKDGSTWRRTIAFDAVASRFIDHWSPATSPAQDGPARSQSLRCYTLPEFALLVRGTGLRVDRFMGMDGRRLAINDDVLARDLEASRYTAGTNGFYALLAADD